MDVDAFLGGFAIESPSIRREPPFGWKNENRRLKTLDAIRLIAEVEYEVVDASC